MFQLHLQEGGLHADVNGDGVLDHVQVRTIKIIMNSITETTKSKNM